MDVMTKTKIGYKKNRIKNILSIKCLLFILVHGQIVIGYCQEQHLNYQNSSDSIRIEIIKNIKQSDSLGFVKDFEKALVHIKKAQALSKTIPESDLDEYIRIYEAQLLYWQADTHSAKRVLDLNLNNATLNDSIKVFTYLLYGEIYSYEKDHPKSLLCYIEVEKAMLIKDVLSRKDSIFVHSSNKAIGSIYEELKDIEKAHNYYKRAMQYSVNSNMKSNMLYRISILYKKEENTLLATKYSLKAAKMASDNKWKLMLPTYYAMVSECYVKMKKGDSAIFYAELGLKDNDYCRLDRLYTNMGRGYALGNKYQNAIRYLEKGITHSSAEDRLHIYRDLERIYRKVKEYELAFSYNEAFLKLKDSLNELKVKQEIVDITEKYESDKKQLKIENLKEKNSYNKTIIKKQKTQILLFVLLLLLMIGIIGLITLFYFKKKRQKEVLYVKNRALAKEIRNNESPKKRNKKSTIESDKRLVIQDLINDLIDKKFYLNADMTLIMLSKMIHTNTTYLSKIINERYNKPFSGFINDLRIKETLRKLETFPEYRKLTIAHIGEEAGFTSINAFYRAFKKYTGLTPSYYIKRRLEQES